MLFVDYIFVTELKLKSAGAIFGVRIQSTLEYFARITSFFIAL